MSEHSIKKRQLFVLFSLLLTLYPVQSESIDYRAYEANSSLKTVLQNGHASVVLSIEYSPDGRFIVSASSDSTAKLWKSDGTLVNTFEAHTGSVLSAIYSPDGRFIATSAEDDKLIIWRLDGTVHMSLHGEGGMTKIDYSSDGKYIVSGSQASGVDIWDLSTGSKKSHIDYREGRIWAVRFTPDNRYVLIGGSRFYKDGEKTAVTGTLSLYDVESSQLVRDYVGHEDAVESIRISKDGKQFITGARDKTVKIWSIEGTLLHSIELEGDISVVDVAFSGNEKYIAIAISHWNMNGELQLWNVENYTLIKSLYLNAPSQGRKGWRTAEAMSVGFSPDDEYMAVGIRNGRIMIVKTDNELTRVVNVTGHSAEMNMVAMSPDESCLIMFSDSRNQSPTLTLWNIKDNYSKNLKTTDHDIVYIGFTPNDEIISIRSNGEVDFFTKTGRFLRTFVLKEPKDDEERIYISSACMSPDGEYIFAGSKNCLFRFGIDGSYHWELPLHKDQIIDIDISKDGKYVITGSADRHITVLSASGKFLYYSIDGNAW